MGVFGKWVIPNLWMVYNGTYLVRYIFIKFYKSWSIFGSPQQKKYHNLLLVMVIVHL